MGALHLEVESKLSGFPLGKVMTHQLPIDRFQEGFDLMEAGKAGKVVLSWN